MSAPRTVLELQLARLWEGLLEAGPVGVQDDFFELGGDSMAAAELVAVLERRWGVSLSLDRLLPGLTVERLARLLSAAEPSRSGSPLVPIQPEGTRPPFFCVHPSGGSVLCYLDLARLLGTLGTGRPFHGLQGPDPRSGREPFERIEDMAAVYLKAIREVRPRGPWLLGGYSFGGYVALEMARQLTAEGTAGEEPPFLALLDTRAPAALHEQPEGGLVADLAAVLERHSLSDEPASLAEEKSLWDDLTELAEVHLRKVYGEEREEGRRRPSRMGALQRFFRAYRFLPTGEEIDYREVRRYLRFLRANFRSSRSYAPAPYPHGAVLFQSTDRLTDAETAPEVHAGRWRRLVADLEIRPVPGHHLSLLAPPAVEVLARELGECLRLTDSAFM